jgi:hypothetical protein
MRQRSKALRTAERSEKGVALEYNSNPRSAEARTNTEKRAALALLYFFLGSGRYAIRCPKNISDFL